MKKYIKKHIKDEKRILKLLYKKGLLDHYNFDYLGWEFLHEGKKGRRRKNKSEYSFHEYLPELHIFSVDYWGEGDSTSVVESIRDSIIMENADYCPVDGWFNINKSVVKNKGFINYLESLPTKNNDSKFNKYLKINYC